MAGKMRVHELAKELGKASKEVISALNSLGVKDKKAVSSLSDEDVKKVKGYFKSGRVDEKAKKPSEKKAKTAVEAGEAAAPQEKKKEEKTKVEKKFKIPKPVKDTVSVQEATVDEEEEISLPGRFKKEIETDRGDKVKVKPAMQRAFDTIRKVEHRKWRDKKGAKRGEKNKPLPKKEETATVATVTAPRKKSIKLAEGTTVREFAELIGQKLPDVIKKFMELGILTTINQPVELDAALLVADSYGIKLEVASPEADLVLTEEEEDAGNLVSRPPVVTIMGHVDHGKTSLLDTIRKTKVTRTEAGGITQHIGAYMVNLKGKDIVFLDTPGHEAFTAMRARGAKVTDIVVLVVAADDGVMPQTIEAIDHSKAAGVPIVVAINKIDKPEANPQRIRTELAERGIVPEEWGGENIFVEVSAKQQLGIEDLLEMILLQAEVLELKANPQRAARSVIVEAKLDRGRGPVATVLVQAGTLRIGDAFVAGNSSGKVRALIDDMGKRIKDAGPSVPVEVIGFSEVPRAGDTVTVVEDEKRARQVAMTRRQKERLAQIARAKKVKLDEAYDKIKEGDIKELNIIIKADVQGSVEAIKGAFEGIEHPEVKVKVIHTGVGGINESDVMLAAASNAVIIGFNVRPEVKASQVAEREGIEIRLYNVIYEAIEDVKKALEGLLAPTLKEEILGRAEVRETFPISKIGTVSGCYVIDGAIKRNSDGIRVIRDNVVVYEGKIKTLKRFKEDVGEVQTGYECGILVENFNDVKVGDILENYIIVELASKL